MIYRTWTSRLAAALLCVAGVNAWAAEGGGNAAAMPAAMAASSTTPSAAAVPVDLPVSVESAGATLRGSLMQPAGYDGKWVVLIIAGSGPTDRDGGSTIIPGINNLRLLAEGLAKDGIASVRYDKRGIAGSVVPGFKESDARLDVYANDAAAWLKWLRQQGRYQHVAVVGHSEGALLGMLAAEQVPVDAYVSVAGGSRNFLVILREQMHRKYGEASDMTTRIDHVLDTLAKGETVALDDQPAPIRNMYRASVQPYLISSGKVDPSKEMAKMKMPVAIIQGDTDIQVPVRDAEQLSAANPQAKLKIFPGMNHVLKTAKRGDVAAYSASDQPLTDGLVDFVSGFIKGAAE